MSGPGELCVTPRRSVSALFVGLCRAPALSASFPGALCVGPGARPGALCRIPALHHVQLTKVCSFAGMLDSDRFFGLRR